MRWKKLGQIYQPAPLHEKLQSHAANPLAVFLRDDIFRVFYSGRDAGNRSSVGYVDIDVVTQQVVYVHDKPAFVHGPENSFYSHGVSIGNCYDVSDTTYMLFMGWQYPPGGHWRGDIGRLILSEDKETLTLDSDTPLIASDDIDPISLSYPWVMQRDNGYDMWYGSTVAWETGSAEMLHVLKAAHSGDGEIWDRDGDTLPYEIGVAQAFSRPTVVSDADGRLHMWYSYRSGTGETYRIGYAQSDDGKEWRLLPTESGITVSDSGWDADMICYPFVFDHKDRRYMLYNGNGYGKTGFGLAVLNDAE